MAILNRTRRLLQPYLPDIALGAGAAGKIAYKTALFRTSHALRRQAAARVAGGAGRTVMLDEFEGSVLSQNGEDGVLAAIFAIIGFKTRKILEFGFAATEASLFNLALTNRLDGYFMDGADTTCRLARSMFAVMRCPNMHVATAFITVENINALISDMGLRGEIDALSIDVDGNDYWLWDAIDVINPRLVVAEYHGSLGPRDSITIAYDPEFDCGKSAHWFYHGASLAALTKLAGRRGYRLIYCEASGTNAFFLRADIQADCLPTKTAAEAFRYRARSAAPGLSDQERTEIIRSLPFVYV